MKKIITLLTFLTVINLSCKQDLEVDENRSEIVMNRKYEVTFTKNNSSNTFDCDSIFRFTNGRYQFKNIEDSVCFLDITMPSDITVIVKPN